MTTTIKVGDRVRLLTEEEYLALHPTNLWFRPHTPPERRHGLVLSIFTNEYGIWARVLRDGVKNPEDERLDTLRLEEE